LDTIYVATNRWLGSIVVMETDFRSTYCEFDFRPCAAGLCPKSINTFSRNFPVDGIMDWILAFRALEWVTMTVCGCVSISACNQLHTLTQETNSASPPLRRLRSSRLAYGLRGEGLVWLIRALSVGCTAGLIVRQCAGWPHNAPQYH